MKVKVASNVRGMLSIPHIRTVCRANSEIDLTQDVFNSKEIQSLIRSGVLETNERIADDLFLEYKNNSQFKIILAWGESVKPKQNFFVDKDKENHPDLLSFIKDGLVSRVIKESAVKNNATQTQKKDVAKNKTKASPNKKTNKDSVLPKATKDVMAEQVIPENMHIHRPDVVKQESEIIIDANKVENAENEEVAGGIKFVDQEQKKEKMTKLQKLIQDKTSKAKVT